jgi:hypothetical protein
MVNAIMRATGRVTEAVLNTITTRIAVETAISKIMVIMTTAGTTDSEQLRLMPRIARVIQYGRTAAS